MSDSKSVPPFLEFQSKQSGGWPWGFAIYRTSYANTSDEDWAKAIEKLDQACLASLEWSEREWAKSGKSQVYTTREGYRNDIFEDPALEGASEAMIRSRHTQWVEDQGHSVGAPIARFTWPFLLDDRSVRSILASAAPRKPGVRFKREDMVGYVNVIDCEFDPEDPENECGEYYRGLVRLHLDCLFKLASSCDELVLGLQEWGDYGMEIPTTVTYTDGRWSNIESKEMFLSSPDADVQRSASVTELEYIERQ